MADDQDLSPFDDDSNATQILQGLISPAPAQALVASPPDSPPPTEPGASTPLTGSLRTAPSQAVPKRLPDPPAEKAPGAKSSPLHRIRRGLAGYFANSLGAGNSSGAPAIGTPAVIGWRGAQAARADLRDPALRAEVLRAGNRPQAVGATDSRSGRRITQPTDNPAVNQALATDAMSAYRAGLEEAVAQIPGAKFAASRAAKSPDRLAEKIALEGQPPQTVSDYGAAQIAVSSPAAKDAVIAAVRTRFPVVRVKDTFAHGDPEYGYRSYSMQLQMPNGASQELQIVPREVMEANRVEHKKYKAARDAKLAGRNAPTAQAAAKRENDAAMARFNMRNRAGARGAEAAPARAMNGATTGATNGAANALRKGSAVSLPDGARATVLYLDPNLKIARVRTAAGKSLTLRRQDLRLWEDSTGFRPAKRAEDSASSGAAAKDRTPLDHA